MVDEVAAQHGDIVREPLEPFVDGGLAQLVAVGERLTHDPLEQFPALSRRGGVLIDAAVAQEALDPGHTLDRLGREHRAEHLTGRDECTIRPLDEPAVDEARDHATEPTLTQAGRRFVDGLAQDDARIDGPRVVIREDTDDTTPRVELGVRSLASRRGRLVLPTFGPGSLTHASTLVRPSDIRADSPGFPRSTVPRHRNDRAGPRFPGDPLVVGGLEDPPMSYS